MAGGGLYAQSRFTVLNYNVLMSGRSVAYEAKPFAEFIRQYVPDFVLLQEVDFKTTRNGMRDFTTELAAELGMFSVFGKAMDYGGGEFGVAVLSKYPIVSSQVKQLSTSLSEMKEVRAVLYVDVVLPDNNKTVRIASTHLDHSTDEVRSAMVAQINSALAYSGIPTILTGDYNGFPYESAIQEGMADWQRICDNFATFPATSPTSKIDYIFGLPKGGWTVHSYDRVANTGLSDHMALIADIELK